MIIQLHPRIISILEVDRVKSFWHRVTILVAILAHATDFRVLPIANFIVAEIRLLHHPKMQSWIMKKSDSSFMINHKIWLIFMTHELMQYHLPLPISLQSLPQSGYWLTTVHQLCFTSKKHFWGLKKTRNRTCSLTNILSIY